MARKRPTYTPRGPKRWERAAINAVRHPNSKAASLYRNRVEVARIIAHEGGYQRRAWEFVRLQTHDRKTWARLPEPTWTRDYAACSDYCATMQIQLDFGTTDLAKIAKAYDPEASKYEHVRLLDAHTLKRDLHCCACGSLIKRERVRS